MAFPDIVYVAFSNKCPRCHEGKVFEGNNPYSFHNGLTMNKHCPSCGLKYERETGYFYGAMYVSYALQVAVFGAIYAFDALWWHLKAGVLLSIIVVSIMAIFPITFRTSRIVWIALFTRFDKDFSKTNLRKVQDQR